MHFFFRSHLGRKIGRRQRELVDLRAARAEALNLAAEVLRDSAAKTGPVEMTVEVRNASDEPLFLVRINLEDAVDDDESQAHPS